jgi:signal transduction histidine kinase
MTSSAASVIVALAMLFLVLWQAPRNLDNQLMGAYLAAIIFWGVSAFLIRFMPLGGLEPTPYLYGIALGIGFTGLFLYALVTHYAGLWRRWWVGVSLVAGPVYYAAMIPLLFQGRLYNEVGVSPDGRLSYHFETLGYVTFFISYLFYLIAGVILWRFRRERTGNLLVGGVIISLGVLTSLSAGLAQYSLAISSAAISSILFANAILRENLFNPLARLNKEMADANQRLLRLTEELRIANVQLTEVSRLKSHFLANMSHELRTPLNSIIGYTEMLSEGIYGELNDKQLDRLDRVRRNGQHLLQLINDILDLSKIEANRMELDVEPVDLDTVIDECITAFEPLAQKKKLHLTKQVPPDLPPILTDRSRTAQVLMNLVSNAVKFTPLGAVTVRTEPVSASQVANLPIRSVGGGGPWVLISVSDTGIGITPKDQELIFDEFHQADSSPTREYEGTGLGLSITRKLIHLMQGQIWLESVPGEGSTFYVLLPLVPEAKVEA